MVLYFITNCRVKGGWFGSSWIAENIQFNDGELCNLINKKDGE